MTEAFNLALANETIAAAVPDREALVWRERRITYAQLAERSRRLASYLHGRGLGVRRERADLANHESGQDHVALYLYNGNEYLEAMLGGFKSRTVPINVNYRYVEDELRYLLLDSRSRALVYHAAFADRVAAIRDQVPELEVLIQVADDSGAPMLPGAVEYEDALASSSPELLDIGHSPDDLYALYTGGTTGMPKGVLWRQHDVFFAAMGGQTPGLWDPVSSYEELARRAVEGTGEALLQPLPFMHGGGQWGTFTMMSRGAKMVLPDETRHFDPASVLRAVERERCVSLSLVGDAMARPLVEEIAKGGYDLSSLALVTNGGAPMTTTVKAALLEVLPDVFIGDSVGSSETGAQGSHVSARGAIATGTFQPGPGATVLSEDLSRELEPGSDELGWFAQRGWVPLGYLGDATKTAAIFPTVAGERFSVPGDRARRLLDGGIEVLGRDAVTINTGGEKVFAEEVEAAVASHPAVRDVVVCGRPSERWGSEVVAVLAVAEPVTEEDLTAHVAASLARYKLPKAWVFVDDVLRSPSGKADYRWARDVAAATSSGAS